MKGKRFDIPAAFMDAPVHITWIDQQGHIVGTRVVEFAETDAPARPVGNQRPETAPSDDDMCVCGHTSDCHGGDGKGHCGATKQCRSREGCRQFTPANPASRLSPDPAMSRPQDTYVWGETMPQYAVLGIGAEAWADLMEQERRAIDTRTPDRSGVVLRWSTLRVVLSALRAVRLSDFREPHDPALARVRALVDKWDGYMQAANERGNHDQAFAYAVCHLELKKALAAALEGAATPEGDDNGRD